MAKIGITETVLRDAHQSLIATRMRTDEFEDILEKMDKIGYHSLECWGGATFDSCLRFLDEDPWDRLRLIRKKCPNTKLQMLFRGQNMLGYRHYSDELVDYFVKKSIDNGIDILRIFDALNDVRNLQTAIDAANSYSIGNYNHISGENTFVLGNNVTTSLKNGVVLGNDSADGDVVGTASHTFENGTTVNYAGTAPVSTVSVGAKGKERTITNLAAGRVSATSTDAVNGSQLYGVHQMIDTLGKSTSQQLNNSISTIEKSVQHVSQEVQRVESESNKGDARAAALAALHPLPYDPDNRVQYMAGYGHYKNANAVALGVGYYHKDNLLLTTGFTMNNHVMANVGITYKPGKSLSTAMSPTSYNVLEQRVQALETQNKDLQETVKRLVDKLEK